MNPGANTASGPSSRIWRLFQKSWRHPFSAALMVLLFVLLGVGLYVGAWQAVAESRYQAAMRDLEQSVSSNTQEHLARARAQLALCLQARPGSLDATFLAARTARRLGDYDEAERLLRRYASQNGVPEALDLEHVLIEVQKGDLSKGGSLWTWVMQDHPDKIFILEALARGCLMTYQYSAALRALDLWLDFQPDALQALVWRGQLRWRLRQDDQALEDDERALQLDPECDEARLNLAEILIYTHKAKEAKEHFEILMERQPGNAAALLGLGRCRAELGQTEEARGIFEHLIGGRPADPDVLVESAKVHLSSGHPSAAEAQLRQALRLAPYDREGLYNMARCLEQLGKKEAAKQYWNAYRRVDKDLEESKVIAGKIMHSPTDASLRCALAEILMRNGLLNEARRWLDDAIRVDAKYAPAYLLYAKYHDLAGTPQLAERCRQHARQLGAGH